MKKIKQRAQEPSTYLGLAGLAQGVAALVASRGTSPEGWMLAVTGLIGVFAPERGKPAAVVR